MVDSVLVKFVAIGVLFSPAKIELFYLASLNHTLQSGE